MLLRYFWGQSYKLFFEFFVEYLSSLEYTVSSRVFFVVYLGFLLLSCRLSSHVYLSLIVHSQKEEAALRQTRALCVFGGGVHLTTNRLPSGGAELALVLGCR